MKVILNSNIESLGMVGDIVDVKPGYARNFLFPRNMALEVTRSNLDMTKARRKKLEKELEVERLSAAGVKEKLEQLTLVITKKAGENDVLFGSVTAMDIQSLLAEKGFDIDRKKLHLEEQIKRLGNFTCTVKLMQDVEATLKISVEPEDGAPEAAVTESVEEDKPVEPEDGAPEAAVTENAEEDKPGKPAAESPSQDDEAAAAEPESEPEKEEKPDAESEV